MEYEKFIQPKEMEIGGRKFAISKIPAIQAQAIYPAIAKSVKENGLLGMTMLPVDVVRNIMSFAAVKSGEAWFCLGNDEMLADTFKDNFGDMQKLLVIIEKHTYDFFVSGDLLDELAEAEATDSAS